MSKEGIKNDLDNIIINELNKRIAELEAKLAESANESNECVYALTKQLQDSDKALGQLQAATSWQPISRYNFLTRTWDGLLVVMVQVNRGQRADDPLKKYEDTFYTVGEIDSTGSLFDCEGNDIGWNVGDVNSYVLLPMPKTEGGK